MRAEHLPIVECPTGPRERGRAHGEALRGVIADKIGRWHAAIGEAYGEPADSFLPRFLAATGFHAAISARAPDLALEVEGIAEGAGITAETAHALQLMDEEWWFGRAGGDGHCSSMAIAPARGRGAIAAQTMDLPQWHDGAQALLMLSERDGSRTAVFTSAGMIGLMGAAGRGLAICVNTLSQLAVSRSGLPVAFVMRKALACADVAEATALLRSVPHASGQNYQLADRAGIATLECSALGAVELDIADGRSLHTNHPLASRDARDGGSLEGSADSRARLDSLHADLGDLDADRLDAASVRAALAACRPGGAVSILPPEDSSLVEPMTIGAIVSEVADVITLSACPGPPGREAWRTFTLD